MKELGRAKLFSREAEENPLVEACAPVEGSAEYREIAFRQSRIDCIFAIEEGISAIMLDNGVTIPVALAYQQLKQRLYKDPPGEDGSIDLTAISGKAASEARQLKLAKKFNPAAADATKEEKPLEITLFAHAKPTDREFRRITFRETQIDFYEPNGSRPQTETFVKLKSGHDLDGWDSFFVTMQLPHFMYYLDQAKREGQEKLDLAETTRPRDPKSLKMD
jgi:hypothetical protein